MVSHSHSLHINSLNPYCSPWRQALSLSILQVRETKAQRGKVTCPRLIRSSVGKSCLDAIPYSSRELCIVSQSLSPVRKQLTVESQRQGMPGVLFKESQQRCNILWEVQTREGFVDAQPSVWVLARLLRVANRLSSKCYLPSPYSSSCLPEIPAHFQ